MRPAAITPTWPDDLMVEVPALLDEVVCDELDAVAHDLDLTAGTVGHDGGEQSVLDTAIRRVRQTPIRRTPATAAIYEQVHAGVMACNEEHFGFDLDGVERELVLVDYGPGDFYNWHLDIGATEPNRKLSVSILLSSPDEFEGGGLSFPGRVVEPPARGAGVVFPSFLLHAVQPVTHGRRRALLAWFDGAPFR